MVEDVADEIYRELGEPEELNIPSIAFWLTSNIGQLNTLINPTVPIAVDSVTEQFVPELTENQKEIYKHKYLVYYYTRLINTNLGAAGYDWSEVSDGDERIRRVSKNEIAKTYQQVRNALQTELNDLVFCHKQNRAIPYSLSSVNSLFRLYRTEDTPALPSGVA